ncbi:putative nitric oxide resistance protein [Mycobacterium ulcerans str. Harvey]|uniref:Nitric oxide resistance protein n=1 Tax=Mycobacterium ulcerans str. Harvey TaxID=1299332 RepID=A0ABN0RAR6_MYCUL|nr:putative nitric oxide resistance protein [Mycobacterium ulcerans str. Harvey]
MSGRRDPVIRPRDVAVEHEVDLGYPGSKSVPAQCGRVPVGDRVPIHLQQCRGCGVEDGDALGRFGHLDPGGQLAAVRAQIGDQRVGNHLAAADRDGQPTLWARVASISPAPADTSEGSDEIAWAATPVNNARHLRQRVRAMLGCPAPGRVDPDAWRGAARWYRPLVAE